MSKNKVVGAPSEEAKPIKTDERDQRVKELITLHSRKNRIALLFTWAKDGKIDAKTFEDLSMIVLRQTELQEVAKDLRALVSKHAVRSDSTQSELKNFRELCGQLPTLSAKLGVVAGDE